MTKKLMIVITQDEQGNITTAVINRGLNVYEIHGIAEYLKRHAQNAVQELADMADLTSDQGKIAETMEKILEGEALNVRQ